MNVIFRVDASLEIGNGHVMRCLALAEELKKNGVGCTFICRKHFGNILSLIKRKGYIVVGLELRDVETKLIDNHSRNEYSDWLGVSQQEDARESILAIQGMTIEKPDWMIKDHYGLDKDWDTLLRPYCQKIMVIDDLADRKHDCDLLLDQTFGRYENDYKQLVPESCTVLTGSYYALLRAEFAQWREQSLNTRKSQEIKHLLVTLGGVDKDNFTGQLLDELSSSNLSSNCHIVIVLGEHSPWHEGLKLQVKKFNWSVDIKVNVNNMAELMSNSDLCIGAAGSTTWERCCLGLPTIMLVLAENQRRIADELYMSGITFIASEISEIPRIIDGILDSMPFSLITKSDKSSGICDGLGAKRIYSHLFGGPFIRYMRPQDLQEVNEWRNHPSVRNFMFNQSLISKDEHEQWFLDMSIQKNQHLLIFEFLGKPQGYISYSVDDDFEADWGFYKAPGALKGTGRLLGCCALDYAFKKLGLAKINAQVLDYNQSSINFHQKLGFIEKEVNKNEHSNDKIMCNVVYFNLSNEKWLNRKNESYTQHIYK